MNEQLEFLKAIATRLDSAGIAYMITGSMALALYAQPRMTRDIDLVVECHPKDSGTIFDLFKPDCYVELESIRGAVKTRGMFNVIHNEWIIKADFIVRKDTDYRNEEFRRRRHFEIEGVSVCFVAPEDLILSKLVWAREANSETQRKDVRSIVQSGLDLDWEYIERWAAELGVQKLVGEARRP